MNACLYIGYQGNGWIWEIFPGKSPGELPVAGKSWTRHAVDLCSELKVADIAIADCFFYPDLTKRLGDGSYWSTRIRHLPSTDALNPEQLFEQHPGEFSADELVIFWGQVLPDVPELGKLFDDLVPVETDPSGALPSGIYLRRQGKLFRCACPLLRMDSAKSYFDLNMKILNDPGIYNLPGFSSERGFGIGRNVVTLFGCRLTPPLIVQDNTSLGRSTVLAGEVIIGENVLVDDYTYLKRAVILNNTYIGKAMNIEDKIIAGTTVIDVRTGVHVEIDDGFMIGNARRRRDRVAVAEAFIALALLVLLFPSWLVAHLLRRLPYFNFVRKVYPKLPGVVVGHTSLVRDGGRDNDYAFRYADQWLTVPNEQYRNFADLYFSTHRGVRTVLKAVTVSLLRRMFTLTEPRR